MALIEFDDIVDESRELKLSLPADFPLGKVRVTVEPANASEMPESESDTSWEERPWTHEEMREFLTFQPTAGAEIVAEGLVGGWEDMGITDSAAWVEELRRKEQERYKWS